jgi:hypothetical protein
MKTVGKTILAIALGYVVFMLASFVGGFVAGAVGAMLRLNAQTVQSLIWIFPKVIFLGTLILVYIYLNRKKGNEPDAKR